MLIKKLFAGFLSLVIVIVLIAAAVIIIPRNAPDVIDLEGVEIREYEGKDLSSINAFREKRSPEFLGR